MSARFSLKAGIHARHHSQHAKSAAQWRKVFLLEKVESILQRRPQNGHLPEQMPV